MKSKDGHHVAEECGTLKSENMKTLVVIDFQYDFADANGSLYMKGAEEAQKNVVELIKRGSFDYVILTRDWHKTCDKSFKDNGGIWPGHCFYRWGKEDYGVFARIITSVRFLFQG